MNGDSTRVRSLFSGLWTDPPTYNGTIPGNRVRPRCGRSSPWSFVQINPPGSARGPTTSTYVYGAPSARGLFFYCVTMPRIIRDRTGNDDSRFALSGLIIAVFLFAVRAAYTCTCAPLNGRDLNVIEHALRVRYMHASARRYANSTHIFYCQRKRRTYVARPMTYHRRE